MSTKSRLRKFQKSDFEKKNIFGMLRLSFMRWSVRLFIKNKIYTHPISELDISVSESGENSKWSSRIESLRANKTWNLRYLFQNFKFCRRGFYLPFSTLLEVTGGQKEDLCRWVWGSRNNHINYSIFIRLLSTFISESRDYIICPENLLCHSHWWILLNSNANFPITILETSLNFGHQSSSRTGLSKNTIDRRIVRLCIFHQWELKLRNRSLHFTVNINPLNFYHWLSNLCKAKKSKYHRGCQEQLQLEGWFSEKI